MPQQPFKFLFCARYACLPENYAQAAFQRCLYWHARLLAALLRKFKPDFFADDFKFIHYLGEATSSREVNAEMLAFQDTNRQKAGFLRRGLKLRVSGRKAASLAQSLFGKSPRRNQT